MTRTIDDAAEVWVCIDCYIAHHYGAVESDGAWFAGDSDTPCDREPLTLIDQDAEVTDWTDSETGEGEDDFSWSTCEGCGSTLGGSRYRLAVWRA